MQGRTSALTVAAIAVAAILFACGGGSNGTSTPGSRSTPSATGPGGGAASLVTATLQMGSASAAVGQETTVQLQALGVGPPGLGAWTLEISFDPAIVTVSTCAAQPEPSACNPKKDDHTVRMAGATGTGIQGDYYLASVVFTCKAAGSSTLHVTADVFADGTIGGPLNITPTIEDGSITCT